MEMQTNSCAARTGQARCVESSQARVGVCMGACAQVGGSSHATRSEKPGCCHRLFSFFFFCGKTEEDREDEQRGRGAAVADSIRHAGLQCKLLHGHRCGFYGWNTGAFLNSAAPALPAPYWRQRRRGGAGWRGFSSCDLCCLTPAVSIREMARRRPRPPTQESHDSFRCRDSGKMISYVCLEDGACMCLCSGHFARRSAPLPVPHLCLEQNL